MSSAEQPRRVVILGGGIAGLSAAFFLKQQFGETVSVTVVEKAPLVGGWIETIPQSEGFCEKGPRSFRGIGGESTLRLIYELNLQNELVAPDKRMATSRFVLLNGKVTKMGPISILRQIGLWTIFREMFIAKRIHSETSDESVDSFFRRRFNDGLATIVSAVLSGIYAGDTKVLSIQAILPFLATLENDYGSIVLGMVRSVLKKMVASIFGLLCGGKKKVVDPLSPAVKKFIKEQKRKGGVFTFRRGMGTLPRAIVSQTNATFMTNATAESMIFQHSISSSPSSSQPSASHAPVIVRVKETTAGKVTELTADHVICTISAPALASVLRNSTTKSQSIGLMNAIQDAATVLETIPMSSVAVVGLGLHGPDGQTCPIPRALQGFGYLIPSNAGEKVLGALMESCTFPSIPPAGLTRMSIFMGGAVHPTLLDKCRSTDELVAVAVNALNRHLAPMNIILNKDQADPKDTTIAWDCVSVNRECIPQYVIGHKKMIKTLERILPQYLPQLSLGGSSFYGIGVNDCVRRSIDIVESLKAHSTFQ